MNHDILHFDSDGNCECLCEDCYDDNVEKCLCTCGCAGTDEYTHNGGYSHAM